MTEAAVEQEKQPEAKPQIEPDVINLDGRAYELVLSRVKRFRADHSEVFFIKTDILLVTDDIVRIKASLGWYTADGKELVLATGHAQERFDDGDVNATSAIENCETSAIGRALASYGYSSTNAFASGEEMMAAQRKAEAANKTEKELPGVVALLDAEAAKGYAAVNTLWKTLTKEEKRRATRYMTGPDGITAKANLVDQQREANKGDPR
jgi:hypothetical protein